MTKQLPSPPPDYVSVEKSANSENILLAKARLEKLAAHAPEELEKHLTRQERTKLKGISARHDDMSAYDLLKEAASNDAAMRYLARDFSKASRRQGVHEKYASTYLDDNLGAVSGPVQTLPKAGPGSIMLTDSKTAKSMDFLWTLDTPDARLVGVATHKYTSESGGAQDHQCKELQRLVDLASNGNAAAVEKIKTITGATDVMIAAIGDGDYYKKGPGKRALDGMKETGKSIGGHRVVAGHIEDVPQAWGRFVASRVNMDALSDTDRTFVEQAAALVEEQVDNPR